MAETSSATLLAKIEKRSASIAVIGLGYVGLPLAVAFAEAGFPVVGSDVDPAKMETINTGRSYIRDIPSEGLSKGGRRCPEPVEGWQVADECETDMMARSL